jgi:3D (Asp-Asp-Asp) domain-containing protein
MFSLRRTLGEIWPILLCIAIAIGIYIFAVTEAHATQKLGAHQFSRATVYSAECDGQTNGTADGTSLGHGQDPSKIGIVASSWLPMHALLKMDHLLFGHRYFRVRDTGAPFDVFVTCDKLSGWNNPTVGFRIVTRPARA